MTTTKTITKAQLLEYYADVLGEYTVDDMSRNELWNDLTNQQKGEALEYAN